MFPPCTSLLSKSLKFAEMNEQKDLRYCWLVAQKMSHCGNISDMQGTESLKRVYLEYNNNNNILLPPKKPSRV